MPLLFALSRRLGRSFIVVIVFLLMSQSLLPYAGAQQSPEPEVKPATTPTQSAEPGAPNSAYDKSIFHNFIPADQLAFLNHFSGTPSGEVVRDKQYRKLMHNVIPDWMFHYGWDIRLPGALDKVIDSSDLPVRIRNGRYVVVSGRNGPYLKGRGLMWIDMQDGIAQGAFYFHPTNGEPTPTVTIFSNQVKEDSLKMSQLPPAFARELSLWSAESGVPLVTTRYFIGGLNKKILLEHDEDYCAPITGAASAEDCEQMNADAADIDLNAAYYLEQTNYATNATAWMIVGPDQVAWTQTRDTTCGNGPDWLPCRIRMTREHVHVIIHRHTVAQLPHK